MERISTIQGELPILLVAPHGVDDENTAFLTDLIASEMGTFAIINRGWKRDDKVDYLNDRANCNDIRHIHKDVVKEEFLDPILRTVAKIQKKLDERVYIINVHGCSDKVREEVNDQNLDLILGYGEGKPSNYTCDLRIKSAFAHFLEKENFGVYEGKKNGKYAARSKNNLNQLFRLWYPNQTVHSIQLEVIKELRADINLLHITAESIIAALDDLLLFDDTTSIINKKPKWI
jgi:hypothetical protein